ncbi:hypothetical protein ACU19_05880 [Actinobaculum suis]|nr:hypothetical protein ACU19_05880 [Actinobaculum suis]
MGAALARNLAGHFPTAVHDIDAAVITRFVAEHGAEGTIVPAGEVADFVAALQRPRKILLMVTAGGPVDSVLAELTPHLDSGDIVVDMGNSHFQDTRRREQLLYRRGINFVGCGTSGGEQGALTGPALMVGGTDAAYAQLRPILETIGARAADGQSCAVHVGPDGAGHLTKTLHNGIEYAEMQVIAEVYALLRQTLGLSNRAAADVFAQWNAGELSSYLLEITVEVLRTGAAGDFIELISDRAAHKGTGAWSTMIGVEHGVNVSMLANALFARFDSVSPLREAWGSSETAAPGAVRFDAEDLRKAFWVAKLVIYAQGLETIRAASEAYGWHIDLAAVTRGWRNGCIIRCAMLDDFAAILAESGDPMSILTQNAARVEENLPVLRGIVSTVAQLPAPAMQFGAALSYLESARAARLPTALVQAQRDYFGAHGFEMTGQEGVFHGPWVG